MLTCLFLSLLGYSLLASAAIDFSQFDTCSQALLKEFVPLDCDYGFSTQADVNADWNCLCQSESFIDQSATAIWQYCGCQELATTARYHTPILTWGKSVSIWKVEQSCSSGNFLVRLGAKFLLLPVILTSAPSTKGVGTGSHNGAGYSYYVEAQIGSGPSGKGGAEMGTTLTSVGIPFWLP